VLLNLMMMELSMISRAIWTMINCRRESKISLGKSKKCSL
jgi:hypothetical protein